MMNSVGRFDDHMQELFHGATVAFVLKVIAAGIAFGLNIVLARFLGADGTGIFFLAFTIVTITATVGRVGMENTLVRFVASNIAAECPGKVLGVYQKAMLYSFSAAAIVSVLLYLLAPWMSETVFRKPELDQPLTTMALAVVPLALLTLHAHALQGLKKIAASISVLSIYVPLLTCALAILFVPTYGIDGAVGAYLLVTIVVMFLGRWLWQRSTLPFRMHTAEFNTSELLSSSMPLFGATLMNMVITWSPILFLGVWESTENIGIYSAASRTAMLTSFVLIAVNNIAAPKFAALYEQGNMEALGSVARKSAKIMILLASPALLLFLLIPEFILSAFGEEFEKGAVVLMILAVGQFINVATGSVGYLLMMSGNEHLMRNNLIFCAIAAVLLNLWLIPRFGILGGAVGAACMLSMQNLISMMMVWKKLNITTLPWMDITQTKKKKSFINSFK